VKDQIQPERRRAIRYRFGGVAEVINSAGKHCVALSSDLNLFGCFVKTTAPFPKGTGVDVRITHGGAQFSARGKVTHSQPDKGMGIAFGAIEPEHRAILNNWLDQAAG
jgi:hypothetical protein